MDAAELVALVGIIVPLLTIAGSAAAFVWKGFREAKQHRQQLLFSLMDKIDTNGTLASKQLAVYQLRFFPEHKEFIVRFCEANKNKINGDGAKILEAEMQETIDYFSGSKQS